MKLIKTAAAILLIMLLSVSGASAEPKLRAGVITPLSGPLAASGESVRNAVMLAQDLFDQSRVVEFTFEDDQFLPRNSVAIAKRFIDEKKDAIIIFGTPTALAVVPVTEAAGMPLAAVSILDRVVQGKQFAVRHFVAWQEENKRVIEEVKRRGYKRVAVVTTVNEASLSLRDGFVKDAPVEIVLNEEFKSDDLDFRAVAAKIKHLNPDAVYHLLFSPQGSTFMRALQDMRSKVPVFAAHNVEDPSEIAAARGAYEGIWYVSGDEQPGAAYFKAYTDRFGRAPAMGWGNAFDYAKMLIEAAQHDTPVLAQLKSLKGFNGVFGSYGSAPGNTFDLKATVKVIRGSAWESASQP